MANASVVLRWSMAEVWRTPARDLDAALLARMRSDGVPHSRSRTRTEDALHEQTMSRYKRLAGSVPQTAGVR